jgi:membrane fusion protein, heavy metal efflux system
MIDDESGVRMRWTALLFAAVLLIAAGAGATYLFMTRAPRDHNTAPGADTASRSMTPATGDTGGTSGPGPTPTPSLSPLPDVVVSLTEEAIARAGIELATVGPMAVSGRIRVTGTVQPNAYRSVVVTPIVAGRVTRVAAELGQRVRRGQTLADVYSSDLAEAETRYLSSRAELEAHEQELRRTEKLVEIGAASRQELEKIHAEHTAATTTVESNRARLRLLGMSDAEVAKLSPSELSAIVHVPAPIDGVITSRETNVGLNVETTAPLFTVVDLSSVWIVGDLYERDFSAVRVGSPATVTTTAYPDLKIEGKVSYIDPQVKPETRTAQVRVEVPNPKGELRLGMYAEMYVGESRANAVVIVPRSAVQIVGDRSVVYLMNPKERGQFTEREVRLGEQTGDDVQVLSGVQAGDVVVSKGSFSIRAERERLGLRASRN